MKNFRKLRYGGVAVALTVLIVALIIVTNVVFTSLAMKNMWYVDMTQNQIYTLSQQCLDTVKKGVAEYNEKRAENGEEKVKINIYFCADADFLMGIDSMRYIYETAKMLAAECDFINIDHLNWRYNPSTVAKYTAAGSKINYYSVIVDAGEYGETGSNWFVYQEPRFYGVNESGERVSYNGERVFATAILSVASANSPIAYVTTNHGETFTDVSLLNTLTYAGYNVQEIDLSAKDFEFSDQGRLVVVYNPTADFIAGEGTVNELERLSDFLDDSNSLMVFMDPSSPTLPNFEEFLETWGIVFQRYEDADGKTYSYALKDDTNSFSSDGYAFKAEYFNKGDIGAKIYNSVSVNGRAPSIVFENAMPIAYSSTFTEKRMELADSSKDYTYAYSSLDGVEKFVFDVFTAPATTVAIAGGAAVDANGSVCSQIRDVDGKTYTFNTEKTVIINAKTGEILPYSNGIFVTDAGSELKITTVKDINGKNASSIEIVKKGATDAEASPYRLMTVSVQRRESVDQLTGFSTAHNSYVMCCGSTAFASSKYIDSQVFGNSGGIAAVTDIMGREFVAVSDIGQKYFKNYQMSDITMAEANQYTLLLSILPPVLVFAAGAVVLIRRKYS